MGAVRLRDGTATFVRDTGVRVGLGFLVFLAAVDVVTQVALTGGYAIGAFATSIISSRRYTGAVGLVAVLVALGSGVVRDLVDSRDFWVRMVVCTIVAGLSVLAAHVRNSREEGLRRMTLIAETAQRAILTPLPPRLGSLRMAARYASATEDARVGGDLYAAASTPTGVRILVGDVCGKGIEAVQTAAAALGAFRQAAYDSPDLVSVVAELERVVHRVVGDEEFVTALVVEVTEDAICVVNCGHPPPLLVEPSGARLLDTGEPTTPLGLDAHPVETRHSWTGEGRLLLFTDGLIEARDARGRFFSLDQHAPELLQDDLQSAVDRLCSRVDDFGRGIRDDIALVLVEHDR